MSRCKLRTPWPIHFKLRTVIGIDSLTVCILFGEISIFHSRVMGLYSSNCRRFFVCRAVNWEPQSPITLEWKIEVSPKSIQTVRLSIPITLWNLKWIGQGVLKFERYMWNGRTYSRTLVYHNTSRLKDGRIITEQSGVIMHLRVQWLISLLTKILLN
jgi:hypothetical protein